MKKSTHCEQIALILSGLFLWLWMRQASLSPLNESGVFFGHNFNLAAYLGGAFSTLLLFIALTVIPAFLTRHSTAADAPWMRRILTGIYGIVGAVLLYAVYRIYTDEMTLFPGDVVASYFWHTVPHKFFYCSVLLLTVLTLWSIRKNQAANRRLRFSLTLLFASINAVLLFAPNFVEDIGGGIQHIDAYTTSITNVMHFVPFGKTSMSIYGHYALLYLPLVKLLGNNYIAIAIAIAIFAFLTYFAVFYAAGIVLRSDWIFFLTITAITGTTTILSRRGQYYQINPHRILFPALILLLIALEEYRFQKRSRSIRILELVLGTLAIIWNLETGLFSVIILSAHGLFDALREHRLFTKEVWIEILYRILYCILSFLLAWGFVGIYNLLTGGSFGSILTYIYPIMSGTYNVNNLRLPLPGSTALYVFETILFVLTAIVLFTRRLFGADPSSPRDAVLFSAALSGCASIVYFLNRTAFGNMSIQHMQFTLLLGLLADPLFQRNEPLTKRLKDASAVFPTVGTAVLYFGLLWLSVEALITMPVAASNRAQKTWSMESVNAIIYDIEQTVPKDTFAVGIGVPLLYQQMGWDTRCHLIDALDMNEINRQKCSELMANENEILTTDEPDPDIWEVRAQWDLTHGYILKYAVRKAS